MTSARPSIDERRRRIQELLERLETCPDRTPAELYRSAKFVAGWSIVRGPHQTWAVNAPGRRGELLLKRDPLIALLLEAWVPEARAEIERPMPVLSIRQRWVAREEHSRVVAELHAAQARIAELELAAGGSA